MIDPEILLSLLTLTLLEIVLGIDNVIFIALLVQKLPVAIARRARVIGLTLALGMRIIFLLCIKWIIGLTEPIITISGIEFSGRDLMFLGGGLFLIYKVGKEMLEEFSLEEHEKQIRDFKGGFIAAIFQIILVDLIFSFDSVITAVGLTTKNPPMEYAILVIIVAMTIAMIAMLFVSDWVSNFIRRNPSIKMLALAFIMMIGVYLLTEAFEIYFDKGYIYFAMGFSLAVEIMNMIIRKRRALAAAAPKKSAKKRS